VSTHSRAIVAALQISLDGYVQGADGELDWVGSWNDALDLVPGADAAVIGGGTYPGYEQHWGTVATSPQDASATLGREVTPGEIEYARWTQQTPHYVLSATMEKVSWDNARLVRDLGGIRSLKEQPGGPVYVIGGPAVVSGLLNAGLLDELRLIVHPVILGGGKALFAGITARHALTLAESRAGESGQVILQYQV
jgi:dihydrofolate reductase